MKHTSGNHPSALPHRLGKLIARWSYALVFGRRWHPKDGARLLSGRETAALLSRRNTGLLLDGERGHLSERESFQNVCFIARV